MRHRLVKWWCNFLLRLASGGYKSSVRRSTSCPAKLFISSPTPTNQSPLDGRLIVTLCVFTLITSFSILFQSQIPSCLFLNDCTPLPSISYPPSSLLGTVWLLATTDAHDTLSFFNRTRLTLSCFVRWHILLSWFFNMTPVPVTGLTGPVYGVWRGFKI